MTSTITAPAPTKRCSKCGEVKRLTEFNRRAARRDGRQPYCRECQRARVRAAQQARRAEGRCWQTGCPNNVAPGHTYCADHLAARRVRRRERADAGLCVTCGEPAEPGRSRCVIHLAANRAAQRAARQARRAEGRCQQTGCPNAAAPGRTLCVDHLAALRERESARVAEGRCRQVGCPNDVAPGHTYCADHLAAQRARARARIASGRHAAAKRAWRERNREAGWCYNGGRSHGPATHGVLCANCAARNVAEHRRVMIEFARAMDDLGIDIDTLCPCGQEEVSHVDHIQPDSLDGTDDFENLRFLGAHCNTSRGNRTDWKPATSWLDAPQWSEPPNAFTTE